MRKFIMVVAVVVCLSDIPCAQAQSAEQNKLIHTLSYADDLAPDDLAGMDALPHESVMWLTERLLKLPEEDSETATRLYYVLAKKMAQYESAMPSKQRDEAVGALVEQLKVKSSMTSLEEVNLRMKLDLADTIRDKRMKSAVAMTRRKLGINENSGAESASGSVKILGAMSQNGPVIALVVAAGSGLLWLLLKKRK